MSDIRRLEERIEKLGRVRACKLCAARTEECESCGAHVGMTPSDAEKLRDAMFAQLERIERRTASFVINPYVDGLTEEEVNRLREGYRHLRSLGPTEAQIEALKSSIIAGRT